MESADGQPKGSTSTQAAVAQAEEEGTVIGSEPTGPATVESDWTMVSGSQNQGVFHRDLPAEGCEISLEDYCDRVEAIVTGMQTVFGLPVGTHSAAHAGATGVDNPEGSGHEDTWSTQREAIRKSEPEARRTEARQGRRR